MAPLLIGRLVRPNLPTDEKDAVYECGEPTIGSSFIQWDLRFYTIALLFIVFDVEVAFFFPWATLYGGTMQLADSQLDAASRFDLTDKLLNQVPGTSAASGEFIASGEAIQLGLLAFSDILVFFGVLLVGFAYVWKRGDLEWVRAAINTSGQRTIPDP
ncbi:MAG: NADH-quinone oxidoreductase subunit A [Planctomycetaceae bacterium]|nr:NADH-quinone oxidoreductase subunit A [Planctomycetaceae bacterium]